MTKDEADRMTGKAGVLFISSRADVSFNARMMYISCAVAVTEKKALEEDWGLFNMDR